MPLWRKELATGIAAIDVQHQALFELIETIPQKKTTNEIETALEYLSQYAAVHFSTEEELMLLREYPDFTRHRGEHVFFLTKIIEMHKQLSEGQLTAAKVYQFLSNWLVSHVQKTDMVTFREFDS